MKIADRISRIQPSITLEMTAKAADLRSQGIDVINLSVGEPDFDTPLNIKEAAFYGAAILLAGARRNAMAMGRSFSTGSRPGLKKYMKKCDVNAAACGFCHH